MKGEIQEVKIPELKLPETETQEAEIVEAEQVWATNQEMAAHIKSWHYLANAVVARGWSDFR